MAVNWLRRTVLAAACASAALLAACGSSSIESALKPARFVAFGDGFSDVGQVGGKRYTVNDGTVNNWTQQVAATYGVTLTPASAGGSSYAQGNARISARPDAAGNDATPTVVQQIDRFLAGGSFKESDVVLMGAGTSDLVVQAAAVAAGTQTREQMLVQARQAGSDLGAQAQRVVRAGAKYVMVAGTYNLGRTPWAEGMGAAQVNLLTDASAELNKALLLGFGSPTNPNILYVDAPYYFNLVTGSPSSYGFENANDPVCTSVDAGNGIGIGAGQVNSALCNTGTLRPSVANYNRYVFADRVYVTPETQRLFGTYAYDRLVARW